MQISNWFFIFCLKTAISFFYPKSSFPVVVKQFELVCLYQSHTFWLHLNLIRNCEIWYESNNFHAQNHNFRKNGHSFGSTHYTWHHQQHSNRNWRRNTHRTFATSTSQHSKLNQQSSRRLPTAKRTSRHCQTEVTSTTPAKNVMSSRPALASVYDLAPVQVQVQ